MSRMRFPVTVSAKPRIIRELSRIDKTPSRIARADRTQGTAEGTAGSSNGFNGIILCRWWISIEHVISSQNVDSPLRFDGRD